MNYDVVIVGAGHNGLVCGSYLAKSGLKVLALERREKIGGAVLSDEVWPGYQVSVASFVMVLLQPKIMLDLELQQHGLEVISLPPAFHPFADGSALVFHPEPEKMQAEIAKFSKHDADAYPQYVEHMSKLAEHLRRFLFEIPIDPTTGRLRDLLYSAAFAWRFRDVGSRFYDIWDLMTLSAHDYLSRWFKSTQLLAALGSYTSGSGGNLSPKSPGSAYVLSRPFLRETTTPAGGNGIVRGGMGSIVSAIAKSGARFGLETRTDAAVRRILVENGRAVGVQLESGEEIHAATVVANASAKTTFLELLPPDDLPADFRKDVTNFRTASTCFKINLALDRLPRFPAFDAATPGYDYPGGITVCPDLEGLEKAFDAAKYGEMAQKPYLWMMVPSVFDPSVAPAGKHVLSILGGHVPYTLNGRVWDDNAKEELYRIVIDTISEHAPGVADSVTGKQVLTPPDLEAMFGLPGGHVHHGDMSFDQVFFKRPVRHYANYRSPVKGLYQCGASTHPGGGVTGVPGHNAAHVILKDLRK